MNNLRKEFGSDNYSGVATEIMEYLSHINQSHCHGYGDDPITEEAIKTLKEAFGENAACFFTLNGTGTNITAIDAITHSFDAVVCAHTAHINTDECGAFEKITGSKILPIHTEDGKIKPEQIKPYLAQLGNPHRTQPKVVSISQPTELGTLYTMEEIKAITQLAHENDMLVHLDGARLSNAVAKQKTTFKGATQDLGIDIVSFGGTKNGMMIGEVIVSFNEKASQTIPFLRKQNNQLLSKMRFISAQFIPYFQKEIWKRNADKSNQMAEYFYHKIKDIQNIEVVYPVDTNALFVKLPSELIKPLQYECFFYVWNHEESVVRWMTSFDTEESDIDLFVSKIHELLENI
ncbi:aminotransferase class V-fold PLP-dependent enzyme [Halosquirtibacter laminarini]|uniref:Aminotransferase class V-fold PLP-dependent enzyme n=1 Tax=Halosquirtibacter laminarini TaxID=3374600 RepID=A0AC61NPL8_9BACT|nr:aminotransferase class V-fold PLP-dependent enzyme [Prolixibacteraceae bacterium]